MSMGQARRQDVQRGPRGLTLTDCVLVVEDEFLIAEGLCLQLQDMGRTVCGVAATADEALALALEHRPAVVLMDVRLIGEKDGVDAAIAIQAAVGSKVVFVTGSREAATIARIQAGQPAAVLFKPVSELQFRTAVEQVMGE